MKFEIFELNNSDILYTLLDNYKSIFNNSLIETMHKVIDEGEDIIQDEKKQTKFCNETVESINKATGKNYRYALWLADKKTVKDYYEGDIGRIDAYYTSDMILSDLCEEGILFAYEDFPQPI